MTSSIVKDFSLPVSTDKLRAFIGLETAPSLTLVDLADLDKKIRIDGWDPARHLTPSELEKYASYRYPKRRLEWLGGRLAVKQAAATLIKERCFSNHRDWQTSSDEYGRPYIAPVKPTYDFPATEVSISHSHDLCIAMANHERPCGIDIQQTSSAVIRVRKKYCTEKEIQLVDTLQDSHDKEMRFTLLWAAKESLRKARGGHPLTGFLEMKLVEVAAIGSDCWIFSFNVNSASGTMHNKTITFIYQDYCCSLAFG